MNNTQSQTNKLSKEEMRDTEEKEKKPKAKSLFCKRKRISHYIREMQLVVPKVVAIAVRIVMIVCKTIFHLFCFIIKIID